jgi:thiamine phosphate synthase YjbQ (UPF0047 family)
LAELVPHELLVQYCHNRAGEDKANAHLKRQVMSREVIAGITKGILNFSRGVQIFPGGFKGWR